MSERITVNGVKFINIVLVGIREVTARKGQEKTVAGFSGRRSPHWAVYTCK